jgi:hypothetical protein
MIRTSNKFKCVRCGVCCLSGPCKQGRVSKKTGICIYLTSSEKIYSCKLILHGKMRSETVALGGGCKLKEMGSFKFYWEYTKYHN